MKTYSIKELENITDVKAHTIRVWEKRYALFSPSRTAGKSRLYSTEDLYKALQVSLLTKSGFRISHVSKLGHNELRALTAGLRGDNERQQRTVNDLLVYMQELATEQFEAVMNDCYATWPADIVFNEIIYPFLLKTGLFWRGNRLTEEHFVVTIIRNKIIAGIEALRNKEKPRKTVLLFLPEKGQLDLLLLYTHYMLKRNACHVLYMGNDISISNLQTVIEVKQPDILFTYLSQKTRVMVSELASLLSPNARLVIAADPARKPLITRGENVFYFDYKKALAYMCGEDN